MLNIIDLCWIDCMQLPQEGDIYATKKQIVFTIEMYIKAYIRPSMLTTYLRKKANWSYNHSLLKIFNMLNCKAKYINE